MGMESILISAAQRRICLALIVRESDIVRFVMRDSELSQTEIDEITGIADFPAQMKRCLMETVGQVLSESNGWFAARTCGPEYFSNLTRKYRGDMMFWLGVCNSYRSAGVKLGESVFTLHANHTLDAYAKRILAQLEASKHEGLKPDYVTPKLGVESELPPEAAIKGLLARAPILFPNESDPMRALLNDIGAAHDTTVGLGDFIISSEAEDGYWSNDLGWVEDKMSATPFDHPSDIYLLPGAATGDAKAVSYQREPNCQPGLVAREKMQRRLS